MRARCVGLAAAVALLAAPALTVAGQVAGAPAVARGSPAGRSIAFVDVTVVPMDSDRVLAHQTVVIVGATIASVGPAASTRVPAGATRIDGRGRFLLPGLADMHVHLFAPDELLTLLAHGVTTVVDLDGSPDFLTWRRDVERGAIPGPQLLTAGPTLDGDPPLNGMFWSVGTPAQGREAVVAQKAAGYDFIKVYSNLPADTYAAIVDEAHQRSLAVFGHIPRRVTLADVIAAQQDVIAHGEELLNSLGGDSTKFRPAAHDLRVAGTWVIPNLGFDRMAAQAANLDSVLADSANAVLSPAAWTQWVRPNTRYGDRGAGFVSVAHRLQRLALAITRALADSGVKLMLGSDAATLGLPGAAVHDELEQTVRAGLSPFDALATATRAPGVFLRGALPKAQRIGVVTPGYAADLILVDENPLVDIRNTARLAGVMARGRWLDRTGLRDRQRGLASRYPAIKAGVARLDSLLESRNVAAAQEQFRTLRREYPRTPFVAEWVLMLKGSNALRASDPKAAIAAFSMQAELYSSSLSAPYQLGRAYLTAGDTTQAIASFRRAARTPGYAPPRSALIRLTGRL